MRILFLHEVGYLEKPIFEMHELPEYLAMRGHTIGFLDFVEQRTSKSEEVFGRHFSGRVEKSATIQLFSQCSSASGILGRIMAVFTFPFFFLRVVRKFSPELVVSFSVPTSGWQAAIICKILQIPFVFRALDVSHRIRETLFAPLVKLAERLVYSTSSHISCNNPAMLSYCLSMGAKAESSSVDLPPLDLSHFRWEQGSRGQLREELGISPNERVVLYMGSFFYFSGLEAVLEGLGRLAIKPRLVLVGGGEKDSDLRILARNLHLNEVVNFTGFVNFDLLPKYLSIADVAINPMMPSLVADAALPNKVLQYMASGLPVVTTKLAGLHSLFPEQPGIKYVSTSEEVLGAAIEMLECEALARLGKENRDVVSAMFNIDDSVTRFEVLLDSLGSRS